MSVPESDVLRLHEDEVRFREAVNATAAATGFTPRLVEKDYFCTVLLRHLVPSDSALVFKGGTCLAKVYAEFYRLSEDLDFVIPTPIDAPRKERSRRARPLKGLLAEIEVRLPGVRLFGRLKERTTRPSTSRSLATPLCFISEKKVSSSRSAYVSRC